MNVIPSTTKRSQISLHPKKLHTTGLRYARKNMATIMMWLCLLFACTGTSWFAFQYFLVPQQQAYTPQWHTAQWIQPADISSPTAYFRYNIALNTFPENAFATVTANQSFQFYVNGVYVQNNTQDLLYGEAPRTYIFSINASLKHGINTIGILVKNLNNGKPQLRASIGMVNGEHITYYDTNTNWQATGQGMLAHPRGVHGVAFDVEAPDNYGVHHSAHKLSAIKSDAWKFPVFDASTWPHAVQTQHPPADSPSLVNPIIYTYPLSNHWLSIGAHPESYFVRQISVPAGFQDAFIRIVAGGKADVFINDHQFFSWNSQILLPQVNIAATLQTHTHPASYHNSLQQGIYDITPYVHAGTNSIAVHVQSPGNTTSKEGLNSYKSALAMDLLVGSHGTYQNLLASDTGWHASLHPVTTWTNDRNATAHWPVPSIIGRPGNNLSYYLSDPDTVVTQRDKQSIPPMLIVETGVYSVIAILFVWLLLALTVLQRYGKTRREAFECASLVFLPALTIEIVLLALSRETLLPQPFPFTTFWGEILIVVVILSAISLWLHARNEYYQRTEDLSSRQNVHTNVHSITDITLKRLYVWLSERPRLAHWLRQNWGLLAIMALAIPMVCYHISYEPLWQDELSSYYAARYIMSHGYPAFPSGFIYPKGELFSYILAFLMSIFGTGGKLIPRSISVIEYLVSLPLFYMFGQKLTNRKIALLGTAMLAFSPYTMIWSRQVRMYEQAQFIDIIVVYLFWRAIQLRAQKRPIYLAILTLLIAYFSHEENFIILPSIIVCSLLATREGHYGIPAILRKKHWWYAAAIGTSVIVIQLLIVHWSHPPTFATDQSRKPQILLNSSNIPYYYSLLFARSTVKMMAAPWSNIHPWLGVNTILTTIGCVLAFMRKDKRVRYCALFLLVASATLIFLFTMQADRYYYPLLPIYYLIGAYAFWSILDALGRFARPYLVSRSQMYGHGPHQQIRVSLPLRFTLAAIVAMLCFSVLVAPALPIGNYDLFVDRVLGLSYRHHFADYDNAAQYIKSHMKPGDTVISVTPAVITLYYVGKVDYYFSVDRALFLYEDNKQIRETTSGAKPIFNQQQLQTILATHPRVWFITDNGNYQAGANRNGRFAFPPPDFRMVYEGYGSAVYARSADG